MQYAAQRNADIGLHDEYSKCLQGDMVQNVFTDYKIHHSLLHSKPILWKYTKQVLHLQFEANLVTILTTF